MAFAFVDLPLASGLEMHFSNLLLISILVITAGSQLAASDLGVPAGQDPYALRSIGETIRSFQVKIEPVNAKKVYVLLLLDTDATAIRTAAAKDKATIERIIHDGFKDTRQVVIRTLAGPELTPSNTLLSIDQLPTTKNDSLFVYYSGHGEQVVTSGLIGTIPNANGRQTVFRTYHVLAFEHGRLARANLRTAMEKNSARLKILITDCCATEASKLVRAPLNPEFRTLKTLNTAHVQADCVQGLFLRHSGFTDVSTDAALTDPDAGGFLTQSFLVAACWDKASYVPQPRGRQPFLVHGKANPIKLDGNGDGFVDWIEFGGLWNSLIQDYSTTAQGLNVRRN
jgi:hypothetical protein